MRSPHFLPAVMLGAVVLSALGYAAGAVDALGLPELPAAAAALCAFVRAAHHGGA